MRHVAGKLSRQHAVRVHPGGVESMIVLGFLLTRVQPCERGATRPGARRARVQNDDLGAGAWALVDGRRANDTDADDGEIAGAQSRYLFPTEDGASSSPNSLAITLMARQPVQWPGASTRRPKRFRSPTVSGMIFSFTPER